MVLQLHRSYHPKATHGILTYRQRFVSYVLELPWLENQPLISCIPEGLYTLKKRYSFKFREHLHVREVPGRTHILFHAANRVSELQGCLAPVSAFTQIGVGLRSRAALQQLQGLVFQGLQDGVVLLRIKTAQGPYVSPLNF